MKPVKTILADRKHFENVVENAYCEHNIECVEGLAKLTLTRITLPDRGGDRYLQQIEIWDNRKWASDLDPNSTVEELRQADSDADAIRYALTEFDDRVSKAGLPHCEAMLHPAYSADHTPKERERYRPLVNW